MPEPRMPIPDLSPVQEARLIQQIATAVEQANQPETKLIDHLEVSSWLRTWGTDDEDFATSQ